MAGKRKEKTITCNYSKFINEFIIVGPIVYQMCMTCMMENDEYCICRLSIFPDCCLESLFTKQMVTRCFAPCKIRPR